MQQGSALGVSIVKNRAQLGPALRRAWKFGPEVLLERCIEGRELTVGVLGGRALPVVEILPLKAEFYDFASKYETGGSKHICPARLPAAIAKRARQLALDFHKMLGCEGYSRTDLMLDKKGRLWILEINTMPGMTPVSLLPDAARAAGISYLGLLKAMMRKG
jgi:D-alanine-D-alanine ligase